MTRLDDSVFRRWKELENRFTTPEKIARALEIKERFESVIIPKGS
jgi:hypothetical protein